MKRKFHVLGMAVMMIFSATTLTSCLEDFNWSELLGNLLGEQGTTTTYSGTCDIQSLYYATISGESGFLSNGSVKGTISGVTMTTNSSLLSGNTNTVNVTIPAMTINDSISTTEITIYNLVASASKNSTETTLALGDQSTIDGSITISNKKYACSNLYISAADASTSLMSVDFSIYFGDDQNHALRFVFDGKGTQSAN